MEVVHVDNAARSRTRHLIQRSSSPQTKTFKYRLSLLRIQLAGMCSVVTLLLTEADVHARLTCNSFICMNRHILDVTSMY